MPNVEDGMEHRPNRVRAREQAARDRALITGQPDDAETDDTDEAAPGTQ